jgi:hypothetical protein
LRCIRVQWDDGLSIKVERIWQANMQIDGAGKAWRQRRREGINAARCTVRTAACSTMRFHDFKKTAPAHSAEASV